MASLFGNLFGGPEHSKGLFSSSNAFRRRADDHGNAQTAESDRVLPQMAPTEGGAGGKGEEEHPKKMKRQDAGQNKLQNLQHTEFDTSKSAAKTKSMEQVDEQADRKKKRGAGRASEAEKDAVAAIHDGHRAAKKAKRGTENASFPGEQGPDLHQEKQPDAGVVSRADQGQAEGEHRAKQGKAERRAGKRQRPLQSGATLLASQKGEVLKSEPKEARQVLAANGSKLGHEEALERLALRQRAEQVRSKRGRGDAGEEAPARHAGEQEEAPDAPVTKKKKARPSGDSDDDVRGEAAVEKRQAAKRRKRSEKDKLPRTIFVGNLPASVKKKELKKEFAQYGPVESVRLRSLALQESKLPRKAAVLTGQVSDVKDSVNAYVVFEDEETSRKALAHNMKEYLGRHLRVDVAAPVRRAEGAAPSVEYDRLLSVFVGNLPFDVKDEEVIAAFSGAGAPSELQGALEAVRVVRDKATGLGKGIAYVMFKSRAASKVAIASSITVRDRSLRLTRPGAKLKARTKLTTSSGKARGASARPQPQRAAAPQGGTHHKGRASWEGAYAKKADGKPGKGGGRAEVAGPRGKGTSHAGGTKGKKTLSGAEGQPENRKRAGKRPAVAARKAKVGTPASATSPKGGSVKVREKRRIPQGKDGPSKKADRKKASKGTASFQVKGRKQ